MKTVRTEEQAIKRLADLGYSVNENSRWAPFDYGKYTVHKISSGYDSNSPLYVDDIVKFVNSMGD